MRAFCLADLDTVALFIISVQASFIVLRGFLALLAFLASFVFLTLAELSFKSNIISTKVMTSLYNIKQAYHSLVSLSSNYSLILIKQ
ncbi:hypothetical protein cd3_057 [Carnobacterium phage cd3]|uniref:Uncharacterized protein n=2 Tax=Carnodivirus TaxID=3044682 RepID=A0AAE7SSR5_9CAUD|nr:hypothetical protein PQD68_gp057 [Carnobacterium phage cd2]YP_010676522.1 hypothetical protein PQD69_gp056 [Carnobacterium phage cd4]QXP45183.1 hypothetical protein cd2_057 [Carnobacterium phage cd2]URQ01394.1 hypothetical protein cd3_057 [Carnobacterium phage cd3]URQ01398.1 hypothetical protein cd4_056 [Carnobacterium phage cd4]